MSYDPFIDGEFKPTKARKEQATVKLSPKMIYDPVIDQIVLFTANIDMTMYKIPGFSGVGRVYKTIVDKPHPSVVKELETIKRLAKIYPAEFE